jgi:hypothetical protein
MRSLLQHVDTLETALEKAEKDKHRKLAADLLALLKAAKAGHADATLVMCLGSVTMLAYYGILTPYHRLVSAPTMTVGQLREGMNDVLAAYTRVLTKEKGSFQRLIAECSDDDVETKAAVNKLRPWTREMPATQREKLDHITWTAMKRSVAKMEKEKAKLSPQLTSDTVICGTSRKAESVFGCTKEMEIDHVHLSLRRVFVQAQSKVIFSSL